MDDPEVNSTNISSTYADFPCHSLDLTFKEAMAYPIFSFITLVLLLPIIGGFGVIGNVLNIFIFAKQLKRATVPYYLLSLAICDICVLITSFFMFSLEVMRHQDNNMRDLYIYTITTAYPIGTIAQTGSVYSTIMAAVDCFVGFCLPKVKAKFCTPRTAKIAVVSAILFSIIYNLPHFFEIRLVDCFDHPTNTSYKDVTQTELRTNSLYETIYYLYGYTIVMNVLPLVLLITLNGFIINGVVKQKRLISYSSSLSDSNAGINDGSSDASALIVVVLLFILCNTLALAINFVELYEDGEIINYLVDISNLLVVTNSSANFLIYVWLDRSFRIELLRLYASMCCSKRSRRNRVQSDQFEELDIIHTFEIVRRISQPSLNGTALKATETTATGFSEKNGHYKVVFYQV